MANRVPLARLRGIRLRPPAENNAGLVRSAPLPFPTERALCRAAHPEGDQNDAQDVPEDHEGGDGQGKLTERA